MEARTEATPVTSSEATLPLPAGAKRRLGLSHAEPLPSGDAVIVGCYEAPLDRVCYGLWYVDARGAHVATDAEVAALPAATAALLREVGATMARKYQHLLTMQSYLDGGLYVTSETAPAQTRRAA